MKDHLENILNYFVHKITNAKTEGINSKIALIEKMSYGHNNTEHLRTAIFLAIFLIICHFSSPSI
ncbi:MAG: transposase [Candidatus Micrarchaeia archaeon]